MLPAGLTTTTTTTTTTPPTTTTTTTATSGSRTGRLRGLSYLRHYAHGHYHHHQHTPVPPAAGATIVTTTTITNAPNPNPSPSPSPSLSLSFSHSHRSSSSSSCSSPSEPQRPPRQRRATSPLNNAASNSWIPTVSGVSGLSRVASLPAAELSAPSVHATNAARQGTLDPNIVSIDGTISPEANNMVSSSNSSSRVGPDSQPLPSIRFTQYIDLHSTRESLHFAPIERCLRQKDERIRVGRASERDANNPHAPVGFSSKVVSRRHCEFWCDNGQWYVKDVKSSSGTFLNHIRLSPPGMESKAYVLNDGDIIQLGIDFKGGEEQIFRCVKIRVELNRAWQKALNNFNMSAHRRLRNLAKGGKDPDASSVNSSECSICLLSVAPCQSLFVAPCSHVWHYKCIRPLVEKEYPTFLCPNCRAIADLDREIEEDPFVEEELWEEPPAEALQPFISPANECDSQSPTGAVGVAEATTATAAITSGDAVMSPPSLPTLALSVSAPAPPPQAPTIPATPPMQIHNPVLWHHPRRADLDEEGSASENGSSSGEAGHEGPMTPMNDAGPFVLDGGPERGRREAHFMTMDMGGMS